MQKINNLFLIDDDRVFNMIHTKIMRHAFPVKNIVAFEDASQALRELHGLATNLDEFPDLLLLDINMPEMDGWEFLEEFEKFPAEALEKCSVFLLSSSIDPNDIEKSRTYSIVKDFISKPLTLDKIHSLLLRPSM
jgi:CheY-like chemotaxis protein